jgi:hypothetical protein
MCRWQTYALITGKLMVKVTRYEILTILCPITTSDGWTYFRTLDGWFFFVAEKLLFFRPQIHFFRNRTISFFEINIIPFSWQKSFNPVHWNNRVMRSQIYQCFFHLITKLLKVLPSTIYRVAFISLIRRCCLFGQFFTQVFASASDSSRNLRKRRRRIFFQ